MITLSVMSPAADVYQGWKPCMDWCADNCQGTWRYDGEGIFVFWVDSDATAFSLRWS